jgi:hypothetical protein
MKLSTLLIVGASAVAAPLLWSSPADACGGCFVPPEESTQVTGHRMILAVGKDQTTLYDQIEYAGDPAEFAWVLPIKGQVTLGVSSDLVFNQLGFDTTVNVVPPPLDCPYYEPCWDDEGNFGSTATSGAGGGSADGGVDVIAEEVVGPYETVQLASSDPQALNAWLADNGYNIPADIQPIISSYVGDGFNFLAMKLVPGAGVDRMQPVRITTPGASAVLPLRMVAAGTGALTTITLYVISEGRYEPTNFPSFSIDPAAIVWNWDTSSSNYNDLRQMAYDASGGFAWLTEASRGYSSVNFTGNILNIVDFTDVSQHGYLPTEDQSSYELASEDMATLFAGMDPSSVTLTRLRAELRRPALGTDLLVGASADQSQVKNTIQATQYVGTKPACPPPPQCGDGPFGSGSGGSSASGSKGSGDSTSCALGQRGENNALFGLGALFALGMLVTRRRRAASGGMRA